MTLASLLERPVAEIARWLLLDMHLLPAHRETQRLEDEAAAAARAGTLADEDLERWACARELAAELFAANVEDLQRRRSQPALSSST